MSSTTTTSGVAVTTEPPSGASKLAELGFMPLVSFKNSDRVRLTSFRSISSTDAHLNAFWNRKD